MHKMIMTAGATLLLVLFGMDNSDHVPVSFVIGAPTEVRLVFLLLISVACGFLIAYVRGLTREIRLRKELRKLVALNEAALANVPETQPEGRADG